MINTYGQPTRPFSNRFLLDRNTIYNTDKNMIFFANNVKDKSFDINKYHEYLLGKEIEGFDYISNIDKYITDISITYSLLSLPKNYIVHNFIYKNEEKLKEIMHKIYSMPIEDRYNLILTKSDIFTLGYLLSEIYYSKIGHIWEGEDLNNMHNICIVKNSKKLEKIPLLELDPESKLIRAKSYDSLLESQRIIPKETYDKHTQIALKVSVDFFKILAGMMHSDIYKIIYLEDALEMYDNIIPKINEYFNKDNILKLIDEKIQIDYTVDYIIAKEAARQEAALQAGKEAAKQKLIIAIRELEKKLSLEKNESEKNRLRSALEHQLRILKGMK
jgi:hypothetical protein